MFASTSSHEVEPGILHPMRSRRHFDYQRHTPDERLAPFVENMWTVTWDLTSAGPFTAQVLPYPSVNASVTNDDAMVTGVTRSRYDRRLTGRGYVVGARFRPGCFRPFLRCAVSTLTDTSSPVARVLGRETTVLEEAVSSTTDLQARVDLLSGFLLADLPAVDPLGESVAALVAEVAERREIVRVSQLAAVAGMGERRLHRIFVDM